MKMSTEFFPILLLCFVRTVWLLEGDSCTVPRTNENGKCSKINDCEYARKLIEQHKYPRICGFVQNTNIPLVCCPQKSTDLKPGELAKQKCFSYFDRKQQVYAIDLGAKALVKEFPHMAAIGYGDHKESILWLCGGTLISHYFVLTAAHCVDSPEFGLARWVRLGDLDLKNTTDDANPKDIKIAQTYVPPQYKFSSLYHDIALFRLENRAFFAPYFKPACLHIEKNLPVDTLEATGWGKVGLFGETSSHLMKVDLNIVDHKTCASRYADVSIRKLENGILDQYQMCAGNSLGGDTCPGDSGGPLHYFVSEAEELVEHFFVAGITSFGKGCGGQSSVGVYTRVSSYVRWIENVVWQGDDD